MGGSSSSGKGKAIGWVFNPVGQILGKETAGNIDPFASMTEQSIVNISNWVSGKEAFGAHDNWFGYGKGADLAHGIFGGYTPPDPDSPDYEKNRRQQRVQYYKSRRPEFKTSDDFVEQFKADKKQIRGRPIKVTGTSLIKNSDDDDDTTTSLLETS